MTDPPRTERSYERHAWKVLFGVFVIFVLFGVSDIALGAEADPAIPEGVTGVPWGDLKASLESVNPRLVDLIELGARTGAPWMLGFALIGAAVSATAFKNGERWAWYALWTLPLVLSLNAINWFLVDRAPGAPLPPPLVSGPIFLAVAVVALLLPYRKFFPKQ